MQTLAIDIETFSDVDLIKSGVYAYTASPHFEILLFAYAFDDADIQIVTIAMVEQKDITKLEAEHYNKADFILVIDEDVTKTY